MIEASGIGWQGRYEQGDLVARYLAALDSTDAKQQAQAQQFLETKAGPRPDLSGGYKYLKLARMAYYVNKDAYRSKVREMIAQFTGDKA